MLLHELAHVKRLDCLTHLIAQIVRAIYWFNPLSWVAVRQMQAERQRACDDLVTGAGIRPRRYAPQILEICAAVPARNTDLGRDADRRRIRPSSGEFARFSTTLKLEEI